MATDGLNTLPIAQQPQAKVASLRIGDIARLTRKSTRAVRLYEEMDLLGAVDRTEGGHRLYGQDVLLRIAWIDKLQALGFSLTQVKRLLGEWAVHRHGPAAMSQVRELFVQKLEETRAQIQQLESLAAELGESLAYLDSCDNVCDPSTLLGACSACDLPHSVDHPPPLLAGFQTCRGPARDPEGASE
jgi:DNA-binding transcriptional MerR regulator